MGSSRHRAGVEQACDLLLPQEPEPALRLVKGADHGRLPEDIIRRSVKREADRAERAKSPWDLQQWAGNFYADSETAALSAMLEPAVVLTGVAGGPGVAMRRDLREEHQQQVDDLLRRSPADWKACLSYLVERWKEYDPRRYADLFVARANVGKYITVHGKEQRHG